MNKKAWNWIWRCLITCLVISICLVVGVVVVVVPSVEFRSHNIFYDVYYAEAPFGVLWVETEGSFGFAFTFVFGFGYGTIRSNLQETYIVKYLIGDELHSIKLDAEQYPIIIDGTFRLEVQGWQRRNTLFNSNATWRDYALDSYRPPDRDQIIGLHIPALPPINQTVKWNIIS